MRNGGSSLVWAYSYAPGNKRVWRGVWSGSTQTTDEVTFWSVSGQKLCTYQLSVAGSSLVAAATGTNEYFGGKLIKNSTGYVTPDRLGSIGKYFPYGQERPSATTDGKEKFATYFRDSETELDYADQRYHQPGFGRFMTPDPFSGSASANDPGSWNRYAYSSGDPVNNSDPSGLVDMSLCANRAVFANNPVGAAMVCGDSSFGNIRNTQATAEAGGFFCGNCGGSVTVTDTAPSNGGGGFFSKIWNGIKSVVTAVDNFLAPPPNAPPTAPMAINCAGSCGFSMLGGGGNLSFGQGVGVGIGATIAAAVVAPEVVGAEVVGAILPENIASTFSGGNLHGNDLVGGYGCI